MAELAAKGTYVKILCHIWYDRRSDNVHVTSSDKDLPPTKLHMTAKKGTQSDMNLRTLLDDFGCGPKAAHRDPAVTDLVLALESGHFDHHLDEISQAVESRIKIV